MGALAVPGLAVGWLALFALIGFLPATEVATALVNRAITWSFGATTLPGLELYGRRPAIASNARRRADAC